MHAGIIRQQLDAIALIDVSQDPPDDGARALRLAPAVLWTFSDLVAASTVLASVIFTAPMAPQLVGVCASGSAAIVALVGILFGGGAFLPLDTAYPHVRLQAMVADSCCADIVTTPALAQSVRGWFSGRLYILSVVGPGVVTVLCDATTPDAPQRGPPLLPDIAYVLFTSGSTGRAKAVLGQHSAMLNRIGWQHRVLPFAAVGGEPGGRQASDVCIQKTALSFVDAITEIFVPLTAGVPLVLPSARVRSDMALLVATLHQHRVTRVVLVPSVLPLLLAAIAAVPPALRRQLQEVLAHIIASGEPLPLATCAQVAVALPTTQLSNFYGSTEVAGDVLWWPSTPENLRDVPLTAICAPLGRPVDNVVVTIVDEAGHVVDGDAKGEILVQVAAISCKRAVSQYVTWQGVAVCAGYLHGSGHPASHRMGDVGWRDRHGVIHLAGRLDSVLKIRGQRVSLLEVEAAACKNTMAVAAAGAVVVGAPAQLVLLVVLTSLPGLRLHHNEGSDKQRLMSVWQHLRDCLPASHVPTFVGTVKKLPLLENGKLNRKKLEQVARQQLAAHRKTSAQHAGTLGTLQTLATRVLLGENGATVDDGGRGVLPVDVPLGDLGLDSLRAMHFRAHVHAEFALIETGPALLPVEWLEHLSLRAVAELVDNADIVYHTSRAEGDKLQIPERDARLPQAPLYISGLTHCANGEEVLVARLLDERAWDPAVAVDRRGSTALMWAAGNGHVPVVRLLLAHQPALDVNQANKTGRTAAMQAARHGQLATLSALVETGRVDLARRTLDDSTVFHWALNGGDVPVIAFLAEQPGVDKDAENIFGCTAIQWAAASGILAGCQWLHARGVDFTVVNKAGHGALDSAAWKGHRAILQWLLLSADGPRLGPQLRICDNEGRDLATVAQEGGHAALAHWFTACYTLYDVHGPHNWPALALPLTKLQN